MPLTTARSDKPYKVAEHRKERRKTRVAIQTTADGDDPRLHQAPFGDPWNGPKDGKQAIDLNDKLAWKWMRK